MPLSAGHWPLLDLLFLAWSMILPLLLLQVNKINSLFKVAKNPFSHQIISLISQLASIYFFMCLFFPFCFTVLGPKTCFTSWLGQNIDAHNSTYSLLGKSLQSISHSSSNSFFPSLKLSLCPIGEFTNWAVPIPWAHHKQEHPTAKLYVCHCNLTHFLVSPKS